MTRSISSETRRLCAAWRWFWIVVLRELFGLDVATARAVVKRRPVE